ncbi:hypothetical protein AB0K43_30995 [Kitasatospora sp. NPDC049258]|uniref:hypothetical protein n=1 Tax=Kitasatospora sp. NPDC049258 TaxID=3155394 RepID=UPI00342CDC7D
MDESSAQPLPAGAAGAERGERPLVDCLADFWQGEFTLGGADREQDTERVGSASAGPGASGITVRGRDLADLLAPAYRRFTGA